jgi:hypothetical protein
VTKAITIVAAVEDSKRQAVKKKKYIFVTKESRKYEMVLKVMNQFIQIVIIILQCPMMMRTSNTCQIVGKIPKGNLHFQYCSTPLLKNGKQKELPKK